MNFLFVFDLMREEDYVEKQIDVVAVRLVKDGSTAMATYLHENFIPLFLEEMDHFYLFMEVNSLQEIRLFCKNCKKSLHMSYILTNDGDTPVLPNVAIKCTCCKRVLMLKKYTEKKLLEHAVSDRFYI